MAFPHICWGRLRGIPFISNIQDIYPDVAIRMGVMKSPAVITAYKKLERFVYAHSHAITVISEGFRSNLTVKGVPADKISVIPNFIDLGVCLTSSPPERFQRRTGLE